MLNWLSSNWGNLLVGAILTAVMISIVVRLVHNRRKGIPSCGCGCPGCTRSCASGKSHGHK